MTNKRLKRTIALALSILMIFSLAACGKKEDPQIADPGRDQRVVYTIFAPNSSVLAVSKIVDLFASMATNVAFKITWDSSSEMLATKIADGYECDIFIADDAACIDFLDANASKEANPNGNDKIVSDSRVKVFTLKDYTDENGNTSDVNYYMAMTKSFPYTDYYDWFAEFIQSDYCDEVFDGSNGFVR